MAFSATTVWEVQTTGSDSNGGGFDSTLGGTDYTFGAGQTTIAYTDMIIQATTTQVSSSARAFIAADVGNIINVTGGGGFTLQRVQIISVAGGIATGDKSFGTTGSTGGTGTLGGALATPGQAGALHVGSNKIYVKAGTYTITSATANVAGGCVTLAVGTLTAGTYIIGYSSTRNDWGTQPLLQASGISTFSLIGTTTGYCHVFNINGDGASLTSSQHVSLTAYSSAIRCKASNMTNRGFNGTSQSVAMFCEAATCSSLSPFSGVNCLYCTVHGGTTNGFSSSNQTGVVFLGCLAYGNSGATSDGFSISTANTVTLINCASYNSGRHGFNFSAVGTGVRTMVNCIAEGNGQSSGTGTGIMTNAADDHLIIINCAAQGAGASAFNNKTADVTTNITSTNKIGEITPTASVFTSVAGNDFSLNNLSGAGSLLRAAGVPTASLPWNLMGASTNSYPDIGVAQHADTPSIFPIFD